MLTDTGPAGLLVVGALMLLNDWVWDEHDRLIAEQ